MRVPDETLVRARADCVGLGVDARARALRSGWDRRRAEELGLVVIELTNNSVRHAGGALVRLRIDAERAVLDVEDRGPGFPAWLLARMRKGESIASGPDLHATGLGAGIDSARRLSDELALENLPGGGARARSILVGSKRKANPT